MKKTTLLLCLLYAMLFACSEEDQPQLQEKEKVQFALAVPSEDGRNNGRMTSLEGATKVKVEIRTPDATILNKELNIVRFGDSYLTEPLELGVGSHKLNSFLVIGEGGEVRYAAPKEGSALASAVDDPLPFRFDVRKGQISNLEIQVISVSDKLPEAFGYASFAIEVVKPMAISVFVEGNGKLVLTQASGLIHSGDPVNPIQEFDLAGKVNYISFQGQDDQSLILTIRKPGYLPVSVDFTYADLGPNHAVAVTLESEPALVLTKTARNGHEFVFAFGAKEDATVRVDWGDGNIDTVHFLLADNRYSLSVTHQYSAAGDSLPIRITGELDKIYQFGLLWHYAEVDLSALTNLEELNVEYSDMNAVNVSNNFRINEFVFIEAVFDDLVLGDNKTMLKTWDFLAINDAGTVDEIITEMHANTIRYNITAGTSYGFSNSPFSDEHKAMLQELEDTYQWTIDQEGY